jgi:3-oxoacyl-[acyl-carrier protein] reductase
MEAGTRAEVTKARRVLVTGASRGIGRAIALELGAAGHPVALNYRSGEAQAREVAGAIESAGGSAALLGFDVSDRAAARAALEADLSEHGAYWGVVCNAGVTADGPLAGMADEDWDRVVDTGLGGFFNVLRPLVMPLVRLRDGGRIVTVSSVAGLTGNRGQTNYAAAKGGLIAATKSLALELASRRITVNSVAPGFVATDMLAGLEPGELAARIPMGRLGTPEEVAACVRFLFSDGAAYVTGQVLSVNGGLC